MAENTRLPLGSQDGDTYSAEDLITYKIQRVKLAIGAQDSDLGDIDSGSGNLSTKTTRVVIATDQPAFTNAVPVKQTRAATPSQSSVANSITSVTVLASNSNRLGATIFNDDTAGTGATLKLKLGATASSSSFTIAIAPQGYYEVPFNYTGIIDGIASAATGNARVTELTA